MCILSPVSPAHTPLASTPAAAKLLSPDQRQQLALAALAGSSPLRQLAAAHGVSRKFVYQQAHKARHALDTAFAPPSQPKDLLFWLPVTRTWLRGLVLGLTLLCHSPVRGIHELLSDCFDAPLSLGSIHNIVADAAATAQRLNDTEELSGIRLGVHDEIFQAGVPVLVGVDAASTYCYLLSQEAHRDGDTWGVRLLECSARGFAPDSTIADFAKGLRSGQEQALPGVPCRGDVFHCLHEIEPLVRYLDNRAYDAMAAVDKLRRRQSQHEQRQGRKNLQVAQRLRYAKQAESQAITLADEVATLYGWLKTDILSLAGPDWPSRRHLLDFVIAELQAREGACAHRLKPVRRLLENQGEALLAFAEPLDRDVLALAGEWQVRPATIRQVLQTVQLPDRDPRRWPRDAQHRQELGARYHGLIQAVTALAERVVRASSMVENINSRLRSYFFLRRQLGSSYLGLLRFFLNHHRFPRSERPQRVGKSPAELLSGRQQPHWLERLGYSVFRRAD